MNIVESRSRSRSPECWKESTMAMASPLVPSLKGSTETSSHCSHPQYTLVSSTLAASLYADFLAATPHPCSACRHRESVGAGTQQVYPQSSGDVEPHLSPVRELERVHAVLLLPLVVEIVRQGRALKARVLSPKIPTPHELELSLLPPGDDSAEAGLLLADRQGPVPELRDKTSPGTRQAIV